MTSVDIVVPCYKYAHYLELCIASVLAQRGVDVRILIIDDCSPDNTPEVAARLAAADRRVTYIRNEKNLGLIGTANRGVMEWAAADYTLLLSADDCLLPGALARATAVMNAHPEASFAYGKAIIFDEKLPAGLVDPPSFEYYLMQGERLIEDICRSANQIPSPTAVVRTTAQKAAGAYNAKTGHTSDMEMWLRLSAQGPVVAINEAQACYRVHGASMTSGFTTHPAIDAEQRIRAAEEALAVVGARAPSMRRWVSELKETETNLALWRANLAFEIGERDLGDGYLAFVAKVDPSARGRRAFQLARLKRLLGPGVIKGLRRLLGQRQTVNITAELHPDWRLRDGQAWGWWPNDFTAGAIRI